MKTYLKEDGTINQMQVKQEIKTTHHKSSTSHAPTTHTA